MEFQKFSESYSSKVSAIIAPVFEDFTPTDTLNFTRESSALANAKKSGFSGKIGETFDIFDNKLGKRIILIGLGKKGNNCRRQTLTNIVAYC